MSDKKKRGDAILTVMQAQRRHRATPPTEGSKYPEFDEAHAIVEALTSADMLKVA